MRTRTKKWLVYLTIITLAMTVVVVAAYEVVQLVNNTIDKITEEFHSMANDMGTMISNTPLSTEELGFIGAWQFGGHTSDGQFYSERITLRYDRTWAYGNETHGVWAVMNNTLLLTQMGKVYYESQPDEYNTNDMVNYWLQGTSGSNYYTIIDARVTRSDGILTWKTEELPTDAYLQRIT